MHSGKTNLQITSTFIYKWLLDIFVIDNMLNICMMTLIDFKIIEYLIKE